jgi:hypothetical protein
VGSSDAPARVRAPGLAARLEVSPPSGDRSQFAGERSGVWIPSISADYRIGRAFAGAELGMRIRPVTELLGARIGTQLVAALGLGYDIFPANRLAVLLEAWALPSWVDQFDPQGARTGGVTTPAEWQLSLRAAPFGLRDLSMQAGGGGTLPLSSDAAVTAPRFRFVLGVRWAPE